MTHECFGDYNKDAYRCRYECYDREECRKAHKEKLFDRMA